MGLPEPELCARLFRSLADGTRVRIIDLLAQLGSASQMDCVEMLGIRQSRASEHLGILVWAGFIDATRQGRTVKYRLTNEYGPAVLRTVRQFYLHTDGAAGGCTVVKPQVSMTERHG